MVAIESSAMNLKMRLDPHNKSPFENHQNVLSHMSAPDLSFWSQMEGTSLFCNSAAFAAAAASEAAASAVNNMAATAAAGTTSMPLFNSSNFDPSFHSLAHHLPSTFNLNSLTSSANVGGGNSGTEISLFEQQQQHQQQQLQRQQPQPQHHPNFWSAHNSASNPPSGTTTSSTPPSHSELGSFNNTPQKPSADFRTVSLPTSDSACSDKQRSPSTYCISNPVIPVSNAIMCQVCLSAPSNGLHFGAKVCAACAAFFRRSVSDAKKYICKRSQRCLLRVNDQTGYRKICRDCRFKRCLEIGMLPENVQHKRHRRDADPTPPLQQQQQQQPTPQLPPQLQASHHSNPLNLGGSSALSSLNNAAALHHGDYLDLFQQHAVAAAAAAAQHHHQQQQQQQHHHQSGSLPSGSPTINFNMPLSH